MNHVLMIAYHYPPYIGSSGIQHTLRFSHDLSAFIELLSPLEESERIGPVLVDFFEPRTKRCVTSKQLQICRIRLPRIQSKRIG